MKAHDLALWLLKGPNEEVAFQVGHSLWSFEEVAEEYGKDHARAMDVEGWLLDTVMDVQFSNLFGFKRVIKIGSSDAWTEDLGKKLEEMENLDGPPGMSDWGSSDGSIVGILKFLFEEDDRHHES